MAYAMACIEVVLEESERACEIFEELVRAHDSVGLKRFQKQLLSEVADESNRELREKFERAAREAQHDVHKPWSDLTQFAAESNEWAKQFEDIEEDVSSPLGNEEYPEIADLEYLGFLIMQFIIVGFNRDCGAGKLTVSPSTEAPWLLLGVLYRSAWEHRGLSMEKLGMAYKEIRFGRKTYDLEDVMANRPTSRLHRDVVARAKGERLVLRHDEKILEAARLWYKCRVEYRGIEDYLNAEAATGNVLDVKNVQKKIRPCDRAVGYKGRSARRATGM